MNIATELAATNIDSYYDGDTAAAIWKDDRGYWFNHGWQAFSDENASIDTINWHTPLLCFNREEAETLLAEHIERNR